MKKMAKVMVLVLAICLVVPAMCFASTIAAATVVSTGQNTSGAYVKLTDTAASPAFVNRWFQCTSGVANGQLATALTAMSLGKTVAVGLASNNASALVNYIYVNP